MNTANSYCQNKAAASGSSFYYSFLFLPAEQREAIIAVYAFCREVDDVVDECSDPTIARQKLTWWATEVDRVFTGQAQHPVGIALQAALKRYPLQRVWFDEILQGMSMDLQYQGYQTAADLQLYCHCVASTVGMLAATIFGYQNPNTLQYAKDLGMAFQIINIVRDIGEDARRGRIYIPEEELAKFDLKPQDILQVPAQGGDDRSQSRDDRSQSRDDRSQSRDDRSQSGDHRSQGGHKFLSSPKSPCDYRGSTFTKNFQALMAQQAQLAKDYYQKALDSLAPEDRAQQRSGLIMAKIYFTILDEIERSKFAVLQQKISITPLRKLWIAWRTWHAEKKLCRQL